MIHKPYTYAIGWKKYGIWYYGVRYSKKSYVGDIGVTYFTSSSIVKSFIKNNGQPDVIKITKVFETKEEACAHESKFLSRVKANTNRKMLNAHCAPAFPFQKYEKNAMASIKVREKMSFTKKKQSLIKFVRNKNFSPNKSKTLLKRIMEYIELVDQYTRKKDKIFSLLKYRLALCEAFVKRDYPQKRKSPKRGRTTKISESKRGKKCYHDPNTKECRMFSATDIIPNGWVSGLIKKTPNTNTDEVRRKISVSVHRSRLMETDFQKTNRIKRFKDSISFKRNLYDNVK